MIIHVVQQGENINTIADRYHIDENRLIQENGIVNFNNLAVGQTIVIVYPEQLHTVAEGDTIQSIADQYGITVIQLLRNNPDILGREFIFPGEILIIRYLDDKIGEITTNGYVNPYIDINILQKNLLYLTYLSIYSYAVTEGGDLNDIDDVHLINLAKAYNVAPIMVISNITETGYDNEAVHNILSDQNVRNHLIENILSVLTRKGYYAANINFPYIQPSDREAFIAFASEIVERLHAEGFRAFFTITPNTFEPDSEASPERMDYSILGRIFDVIVLSYFDWAYPTDISTQMIPYYYIRNLIEYFTLQIPSEKIMLVGITIGYIWEIPYIEGVTRVNIISNTNAVVLASEEGAVIQFNRLNLSAYFYTRNQNLSQVIFYDARGFDSYINLIAEYGLQGLSLWNIMYDLRQTFFQLNIKYDIENHIFN